MSRLMSDNRDMETTPTQPAPTCIVCDETQQLRPCGTYGGASVSTAYVCAAHDDPPARCTGCQWDMDGTHETLHWSGYYVTETTKEPVEGWYCAYCAHAIETDPHYVSGPQ